MLVGQVRASCSFSDSPFFTARASSPAGVLDVEGAEARPLDREYASRRSFSSVALPTSPARWRRLYRRLRCRHREAGQFELAAAVLEAGLVDRHAAVDQRLVDLDGGREGLAGLVVADRHFAGEQLGHAGRVEIDDEFVQLDGERQLLDQHAVACGDGRGAGLPFGNHGVAAEGGIAQAEAVFGRESAIRPLPM
jgi:hypothetical protein